MSSEYRIQSNRRWTICQEFWFSFHYSLTQKRCIHQSIAFEPENVALSRQIFQAKKEGQGQCLCRKFFTRFLRIKSSNEEDIGGTLEGHVEASHCLKFRKFNKFNLKTL